MNSVPTYNDIFSNIFQYTAEYQVVPCCGENSTQYFWDLKAFPSTNIVTNTPKSGYNITLTIEDKYTHYKIRLL